MERFGYLVIFMVISGLNGQTDQKAPIKNLTILRNHFYEADLDGDGLLEYNDLYLTGIRTDINKDGFMTPDEISKDSEMSGLNVKYYLALDFDKDGRLGRDHLDEVFFLYCNDLGYTLNLYEYLKLYASVLNFEDGDISILSFAKAESNFQFVDVNDDAMISKDEFASEFRVADFNRNDVLSKQELKGFMPLRFVPAESYCSTSGCYIENLTVTFDKADQNSDGNLDLKEYITSIGTLINTN